MTSTTTDALASPAERSRPPAGLAGAVYAALATVRDPELDQPVTTLGFVASCTVSAEGQAQVRLRLPTYFCAPNFAFLMVADAHDAVSGVPGDHRRPRSSSTTTSPPTPSTPAWPPGPASSPRSTARPPTSSTTSAPPSSARPCWPAPTRSAAPSSTHGVTPAELAP